MGGYISQPTTSPTDIIDFLLGTCCAPTHAHRTLMMFARYTPIRAIELFVVLHLNDSFLIDNIKEYHRTTDCMYAGCC